MEISVMPNKLPNRGNRKEKARVVMVQMIRFWPRVP
jgi:hypothetical protein